ncbi:transposase [Burkholderia ubonensis]|uniref:transposase n=1 Tax=Burkholderia ubonensis TaxID=101571 RepID=UPI000A6654DB|nr:transposase [Burkholderia ubonensis]
MRRLFKGQKQIVPATRKRLVTISFGHHQSRGAYFIVFGGTFKNARFIEFLKHLLKQAIRKIYLIVVGHPVHRSVAIEQFVAENADRLRLIRLPGDCPELNPDELLNQDVETNALGKSRPTNKADVIRKVRSRLHRRQKEPHVIRNLFSEKHFRYAA